jgi:hypothetical protein
MIYELNPAAAYQLRIENQEPLVSSQVADNPVSDDPLTDSFDFGFDFANTYLLTTKYGFYAHLHALHT